MHEGLFNTNKHFKFLYGNMVIGWNVWSPRNVDYYRRIFFLLMVLPLNVMHPCTTIYLSLHVHSEDYIDYSIQGSTFE